MLLAAVFSYLFKLVVWGVRIEILRIAQKNNKYVI